MSYKEWVWIIEEFKTSRKCQAQWCSEKNLEVKAFNYQYRKHKKITKQIRVQFNAFGIICNLSR